MATFHMLAMSLKNLFSKPACLMYPAKPREISNKSRGKLEIKIELCTYCSLCQRKCPAQAIVVTRAKPAKPGENIVVGENSWELDPLRCVSCGACVDACPQKCLELNDKIYPAALTIRNKELYKNNA